MAWPHFISLMLIVLLTNQIKKLTCFKYLFVSDLLHFKTRIVCLGNTKSPTIVLLPHFHLGCLLNELIFHVKERRCSTKICGKIFSPCILHFDTTQPTMIVLISNGFWLCPCYKFLPKGTWRSDNGMRK